MGETSEGLRTRRAKSGLQSAICGCSEGAYRFITKGGKRRAKKGEGKRVEEREKSEEVAFSRTHKSPARNQQRRARGDRAEINRFLW